MARTCLSSVINTSWLEIEEVDLRESLCSLTLASTFSEFDRYVWRHGLPSCPLNVTGDTGPCGAGSWKYGKLVKNFGKAEKKEFNAEISHMIVKVQSLILAYQKLFAMTRLSSPLPPGAVDVVLAAQPFSLEWFSSTSFSTCVSRRCLGMR